MQYLRKFHVSIQIKLLVLKTPAFHNPCSFVIERKKSFIYFKDTRNTVDITIINTYTIMKYFSSLQVWGKKREKVMFGERGVLKILQFIPS